MCTLVADCVTRPPAPLVPSATHQVAYGDTIFAFVILTGSSAPPSRWPKQLGNLPASDVAWLSWSADGRTLAVGTSTSTTPMEVRFVDATCGTEVAAPLTLPGSSLFALDATGERLAAGSLGSGQSQLFDVATHEPVGEPLDVNVGLARVQRRFHPRRND